MKEKNCQNVPFSFYLLPLDPGSGFRIRIYNPALKQRIVRAPSVHVFIPRDTTQPAQFDLVIGNRPQAVSLPAPTGEMIRPVR
jgi:hypothetical protein